MRLTLLTHYYPPEVGAPQARLSSLARGLSDRGLEVTVHTCPPHYPDGVLLAPYTNRLWQEREVDGVRVCRSAVVPAPNLGFAKRLANHATFAATATATATRAGRADVVVVESPPLFLAAASVVYARRLGSRLVLNVADLWPDSAVELGGVTNGVAIRAARALERFAYRHAAAITAPTAGIVEALEARPEAAGKAVRMPPFVDCERFDVGPMPRGEGPLRVLYAGTTGMAQGVDVVLEAARVAGPGVVRLSVAGGGAEAQALRLQAEGIENVEMLGVRPASEVPVLYRDAHAAVVSLRDVPLFRGALPTKLFEAMAAARPLVLAAAGESAELVEGSGAGVVVPPEDPKALAEVFRRLAAAPAGELERMGAAGRAAASKHDRPAAIDRWQALLEAVVAGRHPVATVTQRGD